MSCDYTADELIEQLSHPALVAVVDSLKLTYARDIARGLTEGDERWDVTRDLLALAEHELALSYTTRAETES